MKIKKLICMLLSALMISACTACNSKEQKPSSSVKYTANIAELKEFGLIDDVELTRRIGDEFEGLTFAQRWQMKEYFTYHCALEDLLLDPMNPAAQAA